jgi:hypothetical protein
VNVVHRKLPVRREYYGRVLSDCSQDALALFKVCFTLTAGLVVSLDRDPTFSVPPVIRVVDETLAG